MHTWIREEIGLNDAAGIRQLHRFFLCCLTFHRKGAIELDSPLTIRTIKQSFPNNLQDKCSSRVVKIRKSKNIEASFKDFVEFVEEESNTLNDPVYSRYLQNKEKKADMTR